MYLNQKSFFITSNLSIQCTKLFLKLHLCVVKGNYLAPEYKLESYIIESNEHRYFSNTGERGLFEDLREGVVEKKDLKKLCFDLHAQGIYSYVF